MGRRASQVAVVLLLGACSSDDPITALGSGGAGPAATGGAGPAATGGAGPVATGGATTTTGGATAPVGGGGTAPVTTGGMTAPATGGATAPATGGVATPPTDGGPAPATGGSDMTADGGVAPVPDGMPLVENCEGGSVDACGSFVTREGATIEFGPYGAIMEPNAGAGFENAAADSELGCALFTAAFAADPDATAALLDIEGLDLSLYTVYRPANWVDGETYPLVTWGNGTCAQPEGYGALLRYVASHGFVVVAPNSRNVGSGQEQRRGIDFMLAANEDSSSPYYQKIDPERVAAMGHSQGSAGTSAAATDSRIKAVVLFNDVAGRSSVRKPFLITSGDRDIAGSASSLSSSVNAADRAAFVFYHMIPSGSLAGHLTLMVQPERVVEPTTNWLKLILNDDPEAKTWFVGPDCMLCNRDAEFEFGQNGLD